MSTVLVTNSIHDDFPVEIEELIFYLTVEEASNWLDFDLDRSSMVRVCRRWRHIIEGSARLWTTVVLHLAMPSAHIQYVLSRVHPNATGLRIVLDTESNQAKGASLEKFSGAEEDVYEWARRVGPWCSGLLPRTSYVFVNTLTHDCVVTLLEGISFSSAVTLEVLDCTARQQTRSQVPVAHPVHTHTGTLRSLKMHRVVPTWDIPTVYSTLTRLSLRNIPYPINRYTARVLLTASPGLLSVDIGNVMFYGPSMDDDTTAIVAPAVSELTLAFGPQPSSNIPACLVLPKLRSLTVESNSRPSWYVIERLCRDYLARIEIFSLKCPFFDLTALACLRALSAAKHVDLRCCDDKLVRKISSYSTLHPANRLEWVLPSDTRQDVISNFLGWPNRSAVYQVVDGLLTNDLRYRLWTDGQSHQLVERTEMGL
ncbi:hypothetical protein R3P38DRAFT_3237451 [Favolaschia claudopus]|uniref:F-box domain-containing protein n=1 Tax=Favolaschia claudopus TaxID=2862362 RepID=A0AAV9ZBC4_9AGAR